jgi:non-ribosomal peptide synthetase component E (peptide arylation enzyme)
VIPGDPQTSAANANSLEQATLDDLFRRAAMRRPGEFALIDPPDRRAFADGAPRYVSYAAADRMVSAIAGRLRRLGLARDTVIGLQMPNMVEGVLALLGVLRAGMIAAPLPLLWRREDLVSALARIGAKVIIAGGRVGRDDLCDVAMHVAAELFSIRHVCGFGSGLADGMTQLGDLFTADRLDPAPPIKRSGNPAAHLALITWDTTARGYVPVARSHSELIAGGMAVLREGQIAPDATMLATSMSSSFAGFALGVMPWLLAGGTLVLHRPFDPQVFAGQCAEHRCETIILPGPLVPLLQEAGLLAHEGLRNVLALWRSPERLVTSQRWSHASAGLLDVLAFGETGLIAARREAIGMPSAISLGPVTAPRGAAGGMLVAEIARTEAGTLALRGPMVPRHPFPPEAEDGDAPFFTADATGWADTGYPCRLARETGALELSGPPAGMINVGGYRFARRALQEQIGQAGIGATIAALPDATLDHRLAGSALDRAAVQQALTVRGANPLLVGAFRDRRKPYAA